MGDHCGFREPGLQRGKLRGKTQDSSCGRRRKRGMAYTFKELEEKTVAELRKIASTLEHEAVQGYTQMNKERLLAALCRALGVEMRETHQVVGVDKAAIKAQIRRLKAQRDAAVVARDRAGLRACRMGIRRLKRRLRRAVV